MIEILTECLIYIKDIPASLVTTGVSYSPRINWADRSRLLKAAAMGGIFKACLGWILFQIRFGGRKEARCWLFWKALLGFRGK